MRPIYAFMALLLLILTLSLHGQGELSTLKGHYLGQKPPGSIPEPFAPGIITTERWEYGGVFTPDLNEFYLLMDDANEKTSFVVFQYRHKQWSKSVISRRVGQPFIAPNGLTMHLGRRYKERSKYGWSEIRSLGPSFEAIKIMRLTASSKGTYVFDEIGSDAGDGVIRYSRLINGQREAPRPFGKAINTGKFNAHPFIAEDESYLIWDGRRDSGYGNSDLYISFRRQDGSWGKAINLGDKINTDAWEASATVTPDGKYLFFHRTTSPGNVDIFWVDANVIETLRPKR